MPANAMSLSKALGVLKLDPNKTHTERDFKVAFRKRALQLHPDKGGTSEQFQELSQAFAIAQASIITNNSPTPSVFFNNNTAPTEKKLSQSSEAALANIYVIIFHARQKLDSYQISTICREELRRIISGIEYSLRSNILARKADLSAPMLRGKATELSNAIDNIYQGPPPWFAEMVGFAFLTISLYVLELLIVLLLLPGLTPNLVLSTAAWISLAATPPIVGLIFGVFLFYVAKSADKRRTEQQEEVRNIVDAINTLAKTFEDNSEQDLEMLQLANVLNVTQSMLYHHFLF